MVIEPGALKIALFAGLVMDTLGSAFTMTLTGLLMVSPLLLSIAWAVKA